MAVEKKINEKKQRLLTLLREMFQLDQPDLDFGLYRIMHAKRGQVEAFLENEFDQLIDQVFAGRGARQEEDAKKDYEAVRQQAVEFGSADPDSAPKVQQARARYDAIRLTGGEDAEIYDHLHRFFSRYYDAGDFMSLRRYGKGAAGGAETYAIPYDGSEVVLHWANKDQYYIKTTENFSAFSFDPRQALQKDEKGINRQLFDDAETGAPLKVHFRVVEAAEGAHNNVKAGDKEERYFILDGEAPIAWEGGDLLIRLNYRTDQEKSGQKAKWQEKRNEQTVEAVLAALTEASGDHQALAGEYRAVLAREVPKGKDKKQPLLARYLARYTASNTMDYFIHKDLGGFLRRELDFYLKNEVLKLDDFVGSEDGDVQAGISESRLKAMQTALEKTQAIRLLAQRLIDFLAQLEDFQKKLWLKKKFVVETNYCITLDRIPEKFYPEIAANERQREEWVKLFAIDEIQGDLATPGYAVPLSVEFLKSCPSLVLDTQHFSEEFKSRLLSHFDDVLDVFGGLLIYADGFQAVSLIQTTFKRQIHSVYADPPYNTGNDGFTYKDSYQHATWLTMFRDRLALLLHLAADSCSMACSIDENEIFRLGEIINICCPGGMLGTVIIQNNPKGRFMDKNLSTSHEYLLIGALGPQASLIGLPRSDEATERQFPEQDEVSRFRWLELRNTHREFGKHNRRNLWYPLYTDPKSGEVFLEKRTGLIETYPIWDDGFEGCWTWGNKLANEQKALLCGKEVKGKFKIFRKARAVDEDGKPLMEQPKTIWLEPEVQTEKGQKTLDDMFGMNIFRSPKPVGMIQKWLQLSAPFGSWGLDCFAGSGATGHAVINLNRKDSGNRKYILIEMGDHFDAVLKPRIQKAVYSRNWKEGKPVSRDGISHCFKYLRLESYEDCLNNLVLNPIGAAVGSSGDAAFQRDYLLRYMLDVETQGSQSLLNVAEFRDPTAYQLEIKKPGSDERTRRNVDLVETFNWLIGLHVDKLHAGRHYAATFARKPDPLAPDDTHTRLQAESLSEIPLTPTLSPEGRGSEISWWFRPVEGYVRTVPGDDRHRQSVLVLWRTLTDDPEQDAAVLEAFLAQHMRFDPNRKEDKTLYDLIYINGTHNLPNLGRYGEVRLLEEEFHRRMWAGEEV